MAKVIFEYNGVKTTIQCLKEDKMKNICLKFSSKINSNINSLYYLYGGNQINPNLSFEEQANSLDRSKQEMNILVYKFEKEGFLCPKCGENIQLDTKLIDDICLSNNDINDNLEGIKGQIENIINSINNKQSIDSFKTQLKNINLIINNAVEKIKKSNETLNKLKNINKEFTKNSKFNLREGVCLYCGKGNDLKRCIFCDKTICNLCIIKNKNIDCQKECLLLNNNLNTLTSFYHISKLPLPKNFEAKIHFTKVDMIRAGITFDPSIIYEKQADIDSPWYNIYYINQDLKLYNNNWIGYSKLGRVITEGDDLIIKVKDRKLNYLLNGVPIADCYPIKKEDIDRKDMYLLIHRRNKNSESELKYICELID